MFILLILLATHSPSPTVISNSGAVVYQPLQTGMLAPDIALSTALGGSFHLAEQRGHVILLAFVQTQPDTAPTESLRQAVSLESMAQQYGPKGVQVIFVEATALVTGSVPAPSALLNTTYDWHLGAIPLAVDHGGVAQQYGVRQVPTTFVIGQDGRVVQRFDGAVLASDMAATLQTLVGPPTH